MTHDPDRPSIPDVLQRFRAYRALPENAAWGSLHIVLEDHNVDDDSVRWCIDGAAERGDATERPHPLSRVRQCVRVLHRDQQEPVDGGVRRMRARVEGGPTMRTGPRWLTNLDAFAACIQLPARRATSWLYGLVKYHPDGEWEPVTQALLEDATSAPARGELR